MTMPAYDLGRLPTSVGKMWAALQTLLRPNHTAQDRCNYQTRVLIPDWIARQTSSGWTVVKLIWQLRQALALEI